MLSSFLALFGLWNPKMEVKPNNSISYGVMSRESFSSFLFFITFLSFNLIWWRTKQGTKHTETLTFEQRKSWIKNTLNWQDEVLMLCI